MLLYFVHRIQIRSKYDLLVIWWDAREIASYDVLNKIKKAMYVLRGLITQSLVPARRG